MGDAPSKGEDGAEETGYKAGDARRMHEQYQKSGVDAKAAVEAAWANDPLALKGIAKVVRQLEGDPEQSPSEDEPEKEDDGEHKEADKAAKRAQRVAKKAEKAKKVEQAKAAEQKAARANEKNTHKAEGHASDWLEKEIEAGREENRVAQERAAAARAAREEAARKEREARAKEEAKEQARASARVEADARAALWEDAVKKKQREAAKGPLMRRGGLPPPVRPSIEFPSEPTAPPQPALLGKEKVAKAKVKKVPEFYKLLNISVDATFEEVKKAYRKEALKWHPDKNRHQQEKATERFKKITEAFDTLFDPERRSKYDAGEIHDKGHVLKLQGHGWASLKDDDDAALTTLGWKYKRQSWRGYVMMYGRIDDDPDQIIQDENDPRAPAEKIKIFWRHLGEMAHMDRESEEPDWLNNFIRKVWKDTPAKWPKGPELQQMNEAAQQEWKERRMVFNRRKQKILLHVELHQAYLDIPDREQKEFERLRKRNFSLVREDFNPAPWEAMDGGGARTTLRM